MQEDQTEAADAVNYVSVVGCKDVLVCFTEEQTNGEKIQA